MPEQRTIASADVGDFHFELVKEDSRYKCLRSDVSDPGNTPEEVSDLSDIPSTVFSIFNKLMY